MASNLATDQRDSDPFLSTVRTVHGADSARTRPIGPAWRESGTAIFEPIAQRDLENPQSLTNSGDHRTGSGWDGDGAISSEQERASLLLLKGRQTGELMFNMFQTKHRQILQYI